MPTETMLATMAATIRAAEPAFRRAVAGDKAMPTETIVQSVKATMQAASCVRRYASA